MRAILILSFFCFTISSFAQEVQRVEDYIKHANTHFWLGRYWQNELDEFKIAEAYLEKAEAELELIEADSLEKKDLLNQISIFKKEIKAIEVVCIENLNGKFPLYMSMMGDIDNFEYFDDPLEIAIEEAIADLLKINTIKPSKPLKDLMSFAVVEVHPYNPVLEEVCAQYINNHSNTYVISRHEISMLEESIDTVFTSNQLKEIGQQFYTPSLGIFKIDVLDVVDDIYYAKAGFDYINLAQMDTLSSTSSEHLVVDKNGLYYKGIYEGLKRILPIFFLCSVLLFQLLSYWKDKKTKKIGDVLHVLKGGLIGMFISTILTFGAIFLIRLYAPEADTFHLQPISIIWHYSIAFLIGIGIPIVVLIIISLLSKRTYLGDVKECFITFAGILLGTILPISYFDYLVFEELSSTSGIYVFSACSFLSAYFAGVEYSRRDLKGKGRTSVFIILLFLAPLSVFYFFFFEFGAQFLPVHYFTLLAVYGIAFFAYAYLESIIVYVRKLPFFELSKDINTEPGKIGDFTKAINDTIAFNKAKKFIAFKEDVLKDIDQYISQDAVSKKLDVLHIQGPSGIGKTALVNWYFENKLDYESNTVFYGDCNEFKDGNTAPYEPFAKAFSTFLGGKGVFQRGDATANQLVKVFEPALQESPIGNMALSMLNRGSFDGASPKEICKVLEYHLTKKINDNAKAHGGNSKFYLVIDDAQWIDENSLTLLNEFMNMIHRLNKQLDFGFKLFLISRSELNSSDNLPELLEFVKNNSKLNYLSPFDFDSDIQKPLLVDSSFCKDFLESCGVHIDYKAKKRIVNYFKEHKFYNPAHILESLNYILQHDWFEEHNGQLELTKDADFENIPLPSQLKFIYSDKFEQLDDKLKLVLEAASFIGETFEANTIAKIRKIDRLELLHMLRWAEDAGLIVDLSDQDDVYKFTSKRLVTEIKNLASKTSNGNGTSQLVKEYHKMITKIMIEDKQIDPESFDLNIVCQLADRTYFTKDQMAEEAFRFNYFAAVRTKDKLNTDQASIYLERLTEILNESDLEVGDVHQLKVKTLELKIKLVHLSEDNFKDVLKKCEETEDLFRKLLGNDDCEEEQALYRSFYLDMLQLHYDSLKFYSNNSSSKEAFLNKIREKCSVEYPALKQDEQIQLSQEFYLCEVDLFGKENEKRRLKKLQELKQHLEALDQNEVLLYGRVINSLARIYYNEESEQLWLRRLVLILNMNSIDQKPSSILDALDLIKMNFHDLDFQGKSDALFTLSTAGYYYFNKRDFKQALSLFQTAKTQNLFFGNYKGYSMTGNGEGLSYYELYKLDPTFRDYLIEGAKVYLEVYYELEGADNTSKEKNASQDPTNQIITLIGWTHLLSLSEESSVEELKQLEIAIRRLVKEFMKDGKLWLNPFYGVETYLDKIQKVKASHLMEITFIEEFVNMVEQKTKENAEA